MAKNKHSAALFEVIHSAKRPGLLGTPTWWFKGRPAAPAASPAMTADPTQAVDVASEPEPALPGPVIPTSSYGTRLASATTRGVRMDRGRNEVTMHMRFSTAVVGTFAVVVALGMAYVIGQHVAGGPKIANASGITDEIRQQAPTPGALDVPRRTKVLSPTKTGPAISSNPKHAEPPARLHDAPPASTGLVPPETDTAPAGPRLIGKNYILVQSYASEKKETAQKLCDLLSKAGVPCSIEKVPKGYYNPDGQWIAVISRQGFAKLSDRDCKACIDAIVDATTAAKVKTDVNLFQWK